MGTHLTIAHSSQLSLQYPIAHLPTLAKVRLHEIKSRKKSLADPDEI